ncbi:MAG: ThiF family adenylyltransferase [Chloroflexi bacterium]|nr:ThiF family adenylyltransferase [Chloroflexota bacterium]
MHKNDDGPSESLRAGRDALDRVDGFAIRGDWKWEQTTQNWWMHARITLDTEPNEYVPKITDWYVKASPRYPWGEIAFYPARVGGIAHTFWHQNYNGDEPSDSDWRNGRLCVDTGLRALGKIAYDSEPFDPNKRLEWHVRRAIEWLRRAAAHDLARPGEPFELPDFRSVRNGPIAFGESSDDLDAWAGITERVGLADLATAPTGNGTRVVRAFRTLKRKPLRNVQWGSLLSSSPDTSSPALWIRVSSVPVLDPWQAPMTWSELRAATASQDIVLDELLRKGVRRIRDSQQHVLLIGFPMPATVGGDSMQMHWLAAELPVLTRRGPKGFRPDSETGLWYQDRKEAFEDSRPIAWLPTENWSTDELAVRGRLAQTLAGCRVALVGAGALGSAVGELLVRGGVTDIVVCDGDTFNAGNMVRHSLTLNSVGANKAVELAKRLNSASPHIRASAYPEHIRADEVESARWATGIDLVIDCTGSDEALASLSELEFTDNTVVVSMSLGMFARRMFIFASTGPKFAFEQYWDDVSPWLHKEVEENRGVDMPWEGTGCWHPLFPARVDDLWMMAGAGIKAIENAISRKPTVSDFSVIEQVYVCGQFTGLRTTNAA